MTWLDIERRFRDATNGFATLPDFIAEIDCYSDGTEITVISEPNDLRPWLVNCFGNAIAEHENILTLSIGKIAYPIDILLLSREKTKRPVRYPLWHDLAYFKANTDVDFIAPTPFPENLHVSAFHSFKGGVGRTTALMTHLVAYLEQTKKRKTKVLLIDADLEAPGITYWLDIANLPTISFVRFLEAVHYPPSSIEASIEYCAEELRKTSITINGTQEVFVLPACVDPKKPTELLDTPVLPEHLARNAQNPWCVGDAIQQLATKLGAELVLVDLRAGLSELASPVLFDPRIERFIVSTIAPQSIKGASLILEKIALLRSLAGDESSGVNIPTVILSLLTKELQDSEAYKEAIQSVNTAFPTNDGIDTIDALFDANLMCIKSFEQAIDIVKNSPLFNQVKDWTSAATITPPPSAKTIPNSKRTEEAKLLEALCEKYIFAERGNGENLLITQPLKNLAKHYEKAIPITVSIGAKGAGKTFNFLQLCREKTWENFLKRLNVREVNGKETLIFPFLSSKNLGDPAKTIIRLCRENCFQKLALPNNFSDIDLHDHITKAVENNDTDWVVFWTNEILKAFGVTGNHLKDLNQLLNEKKVRLVILIDGLEDQFPTPADNSQKRALETLLRLPDRIDEIRDGHLGIIEFVRSDYVRTVISQNSGQFEDRYKSFTLEWTAESFLRLAYWICSEANLGWTEKKDAESLSSSDLLEKLEELWGQRLGSTKSKEAFAARWVFTVLCDLNGRLQARDLVRFLFYAAKESQSARAATWEDRVLFPDAIRRAVGACSKKKVDEAIVEIEVLKQWNDELKKIQIEKSVPFDAQEMSLKPEWLKSLQDLGVIFEELDKNNEEKRFYLPESYRTGLGFSLSSTGRPKVLALIKRNLKLPF
jgi:MinD-like ATPase involved in chromosome partitioning or flagellar assembly